MRLKVNAACAERVNVLCGELSLGYSAVILQRANGCYQNYRRGSKTCLAALDVEELFSTEVGAKACLCNCVISELERELGGSYRVTAVSDVRERTSVDERGGVFKRLYEVWLDGILE